MDSTNDERAARAQRMAEAKLATFIRRWRKWTWISGIVCGAGVVGFAIYFASGSQAENALTGAISVSGILGFVFGCVGSDSLRAGRRAKVLLTGPPAVHRGHALTVVEQERHVAVLFSDAEDRTVGGMLLDRHSNWYRALPPRAAVYVWGDPRDGGPIVAVAPDVQLAVVLKSVKVPRVAQEQMFRHVGTVRS